jgi:predicted Ser/Thr protein kinase
MVDEVSNNSEIKLPKDWVIGGKYKLFNDKKIGSGSFGQIYRGIDMISNRDVAIKLEKAHNRQAQLYYETRIYKLLQGTVVY